MKTTLGLLVVVGVLMASASASAQQVPRLGTIGERLTNRDIEEIARLARTTVSTIYLLHGDQGQTEKWLVDVYLAPASDRAQVRRGRVVKVSKAVDGSPTAWHLDEERRYAQVAAPGRRFPTALTPGDNNRPFLLEGEFTDSELVSIVSFIRSSPAPVEGHLPIGAIRRTGKTHVAVILIASPLSSHILSLRRSRGHWDVVGVGFRIV
jgi:hypothetical protein